MPQSPLIRKIKRWNKQSILDLASLLNSLRDELGEAWVDEIEPSEIPSCPIPPRVDLRGLWAIDEHGLALVEREGELKVMAAQDIPLAPGIRVARGGKRDPRREVVITVRCPIELANAIDLATEQRGGEAYRESRSAFLRRAATQRLDRLNIYYEQEQ